MTDLNQTLFDRAAKVIPGGVNSPVRAFRAAVHRALCNVRKVLIFGMPTARSTSTTSALGAR